MRTKIRDPMPREPAAAMAYVKAAFGVTTDDDLIKAVRRHWSDMSGVRYTRTEAEVILARLLDGTFDLPETP